jgi:hypothetical protein
MAKLGWGTPSLITAALGIIIEIPPGNIVILGILKCALPDDDAALLVLQVNFIGILDFEAQLLSFDASLYDSRVLFLTLEGDMAVRLKWGDNAGFILSVGGFHPQYTPPPIPLPTLRRLTISILDFDWARIRAESYFAVTSNSVQFGAHIYVFFGFDDFNVNGDFGFDVLFQFSPFRFIAQISGSVGLEIFGFDLVSIRFKASLEGPSPWHAKGTGSFSVLFFSIDVDVDVTWGEQKDTSLPPIAVMPIFLDEVGKLQNWKALPPPSSNLLVSLAKLPDDLLVLHPFGALTVSQRTLPLALTLDKVGSQKPSDVNRVDITVATSGVTVLPLAPAPEQFAMAQFLAMSDAEKLSRPSFQDMKGGVTIGATSALASSKMTRRTIDYQVTIIDKEPVRPRPRLKAVDGLFVGFLAGASVARSELSMQRKSQLQPFAEKVAVGAGGYTVATQSDNRAFDAGSRFTSEAAAADYLRGKVASDPALVHQLHVLPDDEVQGP